MNFIKRNFTFLLVGFALVMFFSACDPVGKVPTVITPTKNFDNSVYIVWNEKFLELDRYAKGYRPGPGPRVLGYMGLAAYEAVVAGMPEYNSLKNLYSGLDIPDVEEDAEYYWPACINESYAYLMKRYLFHMEGEYPNLFQGIETLRAQQHDKYAQAADPVVLERSEKYGQAVAAAVYEWSKTDQFGHNAHLNPQPQDYNPPVGPGLWQPTWPNFGRAMFPYWGSVRRFAMRDADILAKPPIPYSEDEASLFYSQGLEVYATVKNIENNGPGAYEARWIGEFWSDDLLNVTFAPPPRLAAIANQVVLREEIDLAKAAELYAKLGLALNDAGVAIWYSKFVYNIERPISYIRRVVSKKFPDAVDWKTTLNDPISGTKGLTPAFPAYPSGHSGFGGAGGKILSAMFEYTDEHPGTYVFTDNCHKDRSDFIGTPRTFNSFKDLANEDAYSRIPLGVHFRMDCDEGLRLGELAAQRVLELPWKK